MLTQTFQAAAPLDVRRSSASPKEDTQVSGYAADFLAIKLERWHSHKH
jgi:hypothetical protein